MRRIGAGALALLVLGCGGDLTVPSEAELDGTWSGTAGTGTMTLTLAEADGDISGTGTLSGVRGNAALTLEGTRTRRAVALTVSSPGYEPFSMSGSIDGLSLAGTMNGSGFDQTPFSLTRE